MTLSAIIQVDHLSKHYKVPVRETLTIGLLALSRFIWRLGVRGYSGASA
jgi:ABC-type uncharacterized transport system permease subunit